MDHTEGGEAMETSAEAPHLRRKDNDQPRQQLESRNESEDQLSSRSPETFLETLTGKGPSNDPAEQSASPEVMVEELTVKNYRIPSLYDSAASSSSGIEPSVGRGMWQNFTRLGGAPPRDAVVKESPLEMANREEARNLYLPQFGAGRPPTPVGQLGMNTSVGSEHLHGGGHSPVSHSAPTSFAGGIRTKMLSASGFSQFMVKNNLKGKTIAYRHQEAQKFPGIVTGTQNNERVNEKVDITSNPSHKPGAKPDGTALFGGGAITTTDAIHDGISLREWLKQTQHNFNKAERLRVFRQIVELVDITHSQGLALQYLRPSYFRILPVNQVKYIGSLVSEGQLVQLPGSTDENIHSLEHNLKRKKYLEQEADAHLSPKQEKLGENYQIGVQNKFSFRGGLKGDVTKETDAGIFKRSSESDYRKQLKMGESYYAGKMPKSPVTSSFGGQLATSGIMKLEERWYASPEEINENTFYRSSNIYNLGVLFFELFCCFETWEEHSTALSDLRHRILPSNFLSGSPKEASFCLWLLHPEPCSRPKSRDILTCGLVSEGKDLSSLDQSSASIDEEDAEADLLLHFLLNLKEQKEKHAAKLTGNLGCLQADIEEVERRHSPRAKFLSSARDMWNNSNEISDTCLHRGPIHVEAMSRLSMSSINEDRLMRNIDQLENAYFSMRSKIELSVTNAAARSDKDVLMIRDRYSQVQNNADALKESTDRLGTFFEGLCKYARYSRFEECGSLRSVDTLNSANVICSLSFDRDEEYFATAGVSKKIKIFEYSSLLNDSVDIHYPLIEMSSRSKLSCVCWNSYIKNYLASTDYDGVVQLWDASTGQGFMQYAEHQKRAWSVDFSQTDPLKLASGSDDCSMKLWSINEKKCINTIRSMANICCVQFSSYSSQLLAFGSADYKIYCYDLRNTRIPWCTLSGHGKAVSFVKFIDSKTLVSASTDNTIKLWDLNKTNTGGLSTDACSLTFTGHTNEKNFVGLSVSDGYIACGSESNDVYAYYKTFPMPTASHKFGSIDPITGQETSDDNGQFVSSVCWRTKSNTVVAANSSGSIKLLQLV